jgi:hypothetical protein
MSSFRKADRAKVPLKIMIEGVTGSGKTWSALLMAKGMVKDPTNVFLIDSEMGRGELYSHLYDYKYARVEVPHQPSKYVALIREAVDAGAEAIIVDSSTHPWKFILEYKDQLDAKPNSNRWANWGKVKPLFDELKNAIIQCPVHVIVTTRSKTEYMQQGSGDHARIVKQGTAAILEPEAEYDFLLVLTIDRTHQATASKDNTGLFDHMPPKVLAVEDGKRCLKWHSEGVGEFRPSKDWEQLGNNQIASQAEQEAREMGITGNIDDKPHQQPAVRSTNDAHAPAPRSAPKPSHGHEAYGWSPPHWPSDANFKHRFTEAQPKVITQALLRNSIPHDPARVVELLAIEFGINGDARKSFGAHKLCIEFLSNHGDHVSKLADALGTE